MRREVFVARSTLVLQAAAARLQAIDPPYVDLADTDGLVRDTRESLHLGFTGRLAIHPRQVDPILGVFTPTQEQFDRACAILDAYKQATEGDRLGAVMFGDEMIDEASRKMAIKFVTRGERAGLKRS